MDEAEIRELVVVRGVLDDYALDPRDHVRAVRRLDVKPDLLLALLREDPRKDMLLACTRNQDVLDLYADDADPVLRASVAYNPHTRPVTVLALADDYDALVRLNAGLNGNLDRSERVHLARHDPHPQVRDRVWWAMSTKRGREVLAGERVNWMNFTEPPDPFDIPIVVLWEDIEGGFTFIASTDQVRVGDERPLRYLPDSA